MEKKQSSIEWFQEQIIKIVNGTCELSEIEIFEQAKAMHKEEIVESYREGRTDQQSSSNSFYNRNAEQYYNQTFGGEK